MAARRSGRRPGESGTREAIAAAARRQFAELGYDRTSLRSVAGEAGVDPGLVIYFFGSKQKLFVAVMGLPVDPAEVFPALIAGPRGEVGLRFARFVAGLLENPEARQRVVGLVRAAASEPEAARMVRELVTRQITARVAAHLNADHAELRANLVGSQLIGVVMARHVVGVEPLASLPADELAAAIAPNLQRYLTAPLGLTDTPRISRPRSSREG